MQSYFGMNHNLHANAIRIQFWSKNQAESDRGQKGWAYGLYLEITDGSFSCTWCLAGLWSGWIDMCMEKWDLRLCFKVIPRWTVGSAVQGILLFLSWSMHLLKLLFVSLLSIRGFSRSSLWSAMNRWNYTYMADSHWHQRILASLHELRSLPVSILLGLGFLLHVCWVPKSIWVPGFFAFSFVPFFFCVGLYAQGSSDKHSKYSRGCELRYLTTEAEPS